MVKRFQAPIGVIIIVGLVVLTYVFYQNFSGRVDSAAVTMAAKAPVGSLFMVSTSGYVNLEDEINETLLAETAQDPQVLAFYENVKSQFFARVGEMPVEIQAEFKAIRQSFYDAGLHLDPKVCGVFYNSYDRQAKMTDGCFYVISAGGQERLAAIKEFIQIVLLKFDPEHACVISEDSGGFLAPVTKYQMQNDTVSLSLALKGEYVIAVLANDKYQQKYLDLLAVCCGNQETKFGDFDDSIFKGDDIVAMFNTQAYLKWLKEMVENIDSVDVGSVEIKDTVDLLKGLPLEDFGKIYYRLGFLGKQLTLDVVATESTSNTEMLRPINTGLLRTVPADATFVSIINYDLPEIIKSYTELLNATVKPDDLSQVSDFIVEFETDNAIVLREGIMHNLTGELVVSFTVNPNSGLLNSTGFVVATVNNSDLFISEINKTINNILTITNGVLPITYEQVDADGVRLDCLNIPPLIPYGVQPVMARLDDTHIVMGMDQAAVNKTISLYASDTPKGTILSNAKFKAALAGSPADKYYFQYTDSGALLNACSVTGNTYWPVLTRLALDYDIQLPAALPQLSDKFNVLPPSVAWCYINGNDKIGWYYTTDGTVAAAYLGSCIGIGAGSVLVPAIIEASEQAKSILENK